MNPIIPTVNSADPAARVWPNDDRLWIYASHDQPGTNTHDNMISYHVFSSSDLVNWTDYGVALHLDQVEWAISHMWAIDCIFYRGLYYLIYCAIEKGTRWFRTGLATSTLPQGPFTDIGFVKGVHNGQDPAMLIDDDGTPYLYWGYGKQIFACELTEDLLAAKEETIIELTGQLTWCFEGPWVHKYQGRYYLSYPGLYQDKWPEQMYYAVADKPLGPYTYQGCYIPEFMGRAGTNHGSIVEYKGQWYAFHHSAWQTNNGVCRSLMCDYLHYNDDGTIQPITPSKEGVAAPGAAPGPSRVTILLEAENAPVACGKLIETRVANEGDGFSGHGYVTGFDIPHAGVQVMVQQGIDAQYDLTIRYRAPEGEYHNVLMVNATKIDDPDSPDPLRFDKRITFPQTTEWQDKFIGTVQLKTGDNYIKLYASIDATREAGGIEVDYFRLEPKGA